ncbi:MAG: GHKL domain-containing protein [Clostridia bacterium]|nr:GHKL domain-containing protein [Clostridia bacterium]MBQ6467373.1 GHKL domain-containing protein [Clostridia bacterium]
MSKAIIYAFSAIAEIYIATCFFSWLGSKHITKTIHNICIIVICVLQTVNALLLGDTSYMMLVTIIVLFLTSLLYRIKWALRIIGSVILCIIMALAEMIVVLITTLGGRVDVPTIQENMYLFAICVLLAKFTTYILIYFLTQKKHHMNSGFTFGFVVSTLILPISSILVISLLYHCCYRFNSNSFQILTLLSAITLIAANILVFVIINRQGDYISTKEQLLFAEQSIKQQMEHYRELFKSQEEIQIFRHDTKNFFISLQSLLSAGDINSAKDIINNKLNLLDIEQGKIINTKNPVIDSIISYKKAYAESFNIVFDISIKITVPIRINELEFGVLLGNAIDNAIEAEQNMPVNQRCISVQIVSVDETITVYINNPVKEEVTSLLSSKKDKFYHGFGLKSMKTIAEKYNGILETSCDSNEFRLNIIMQNVSN